MIIIGLTGSIGMGKSTCGKIFNDMGVPVHESDHAVHDILSQNPDAQRQIIAAFPALSLPFDRTELGKLIFNHDENRRKLESILHPLVRTAQADFIKAKEDEGFSCVVLDIPLLYETNANERCDYVVVVSAPYAMQKQRVLARDNMSEDKFNAILKRQMPDDEKRQRADFIISTDSDISKTRDDIQSIITTIKKERTC